MFAGRRKECCVWQWFKFYEVLSKSVCLAVMKDGKECGAKISGKNATNLKAHINRCHPKEADELSAIENDRATKSKQNLAASHSRTTTSGCLKKNQTLAECMSRRVDHWHPDSAEHKARIASVLNMLTDTGHPVTLVDNRSFREMIECCDPKFKMPASAKIQQLLTDKMEVSVNKLKTILSASRKVTICLDGWTKKGLSTSFVGISACFFDAMADKPQHALLSLDVIQHPHSGEKLSKCIELCLTKWEIPAEKILLIVSDNASNMVKAIRLLHERDTAAAGAAVAAAQNTSDETGMDDSDDQERIEAENEHDDNELGYAVDMTRFVEGLAYHRLACLCHTLQLLIHEVYNSDEYQDIIQKARRLVAKVRKSSVIMEKIVSRCGKTVVSDNNTRWNSTYMMLKRLLDIKPQLNEVLDEMKIDTLLASEWVLIDEVIALLEPFREQTDVLQTDASSLSNIIPSLMELECHLDQFPSSKSLTKSLLLNLRKRFSVLLEPTDQNFNPIPSAACLLDPTCASVILGFDTSAIREKAKTYILAQAAASPNVQNVAGADMLQPHSSAAGTSNAEPPLKKWKCLAAKQLAARPSAPMTYNCPQSELSKYLIEVRNSPPVTNALDFWRQRRQVYPLLYPLAEDLLCAPASQAYVERIFSVCGMLTSGRRNRMEKSLEMRVFLKLNRHIIID